MNHDTILAAGAWAAIIVFVVCSVLILLGILALAAQAFRSRPKKMSPAEAAGLIQDVRQRTLTEHEQNMAHWYEVDPEEPFRDGHVKRMQPPS